ncbi:hypothetical protein NDA11_004665 [Ustilago hordei]|uniref:Methyltransferase domain-containing protein n=1 Tax=Ustilago hordei TaxID=120017 RepID=I2FNN6_USTHO|nr:uncharacterized protein UHO2_07178 [Ustilago hordei]KAJ1570211.1 hypothetical protein NDA12_003837 [Ustilago hordei]KAJ1572021.1 hypothetical protein NDA15_002883 [Ustilago hordei]KAJ1574299.1 hypothetical protein NDA11_004665 [Ustilago hordei]CCF48529.1 uncharacterized protein UHOR_03297 [Ustilago hordei]SYW85237.1 related to MTQ1 - S-adenosylmethionine-dependent methyltransferase [Ustilago hordei]
MLARTTKSASTSSAIRTVLPSTTRQLHISPSLYSSRQSPSQASKRAERFFTADDPLLRALRRKQKSYRLRSISSPNPRKSDRLEATSLAKSEIRWAVQHVRFSQSSSSSSLSRASRRALIQMCTRMTRENAPLSYLLGSMPFGNLPQELTVRPPVLLPRPETEHWATQVVNELIKSLEREGRKDIRVVDLCTGSGCIALLIAHALRAKLGSEEKWRVVACDKSPLAVDLAQENAVKLGFKIDESDSNLHIVEADIFDDASMDKLAELAGGPFDLILSNPPYVPQREWSNLSPEVKLHEDPAALIGERSIPTSTGPTFNSDPPSRTTTTDETKTREAYLDRAGLAFHSRLAILLYRSSFSTRSPPLPHLVAEYGKGQQKPVEKLHYELQPPKHRLPTIKRIEGHPLVVVGVGNATTHPLTRHSIGQVVLEPLLERVIAQDRTMRAKLREVRDQLEELRLEALENGKVDVNQCRDWADSVPKLLPIEGLNEGFDLEAEQDVATSLKKDQSGGWSASLQLLIPSSPAFLYQPSNPAVPPPTIYCVEALFYKPSQPMNLSGQGLKNFLTHHHPQYPSSSSSSEPSQQVWRIENDILILQDELDLAFGEVKRKDSGSARGHNGIRDIISRLNIPDQPSHSKGGEGDGLKLSRIRIGIGRPETRQKQQGGKDSWLPSSLSKSKKGGKPIAIDRWVLSPLKADERESCEGGKVLEDTNELCLGWIRDRCSTLASSSSGPVEGEGGLEKLRVESRKDQFGVFRTVWVY